VSHPPGATLEERIAAADPSLFNRVPAQLARDDKISLLALHLAAAETLGSFRYLEIGSHLGGSLQVLVADPRCAEIVSIDARPPSQPDERGIVWPYPDNSTARMLDCLAEVPGADLAKLTTIDAGTEALEPGDIPFVPDVCFVDGEHTDGAVVRDLRFCRRLVRDRGVIAFHDAWIVHRGLRAALDEFSADGVPFSARHLPESVLVVELGTPRLVSQRAIVERALDAWQGYLSSAAKAREAWERQPAN
jgi:hypothetical protein